MHGMHKWYSQCETETRIIWMRFDFKVWTRVFPTFLSENCYTLLLTLVL